MMNPQVDASYVSSKLQSMRMFLPDHLPPLADKKSHTSGIFIPYINQRDGIGKLITSRSNSNNQAKQLSIPKPTILNSNNKIRFEKFRQAKLEIQAKIDPTLRKQLLSKQLETHQSSKSPRETINLRPYEVDHQKLNQIVKSGSQIFKKVTMLKKVPSSHFKHSTTESPRISSDSKPIKVKHPTVIQQLQRQLNQKLMKVKYGNDYPQMRRFRKMEKLSIKVIDNFTKSHQLFLQKVIQSKQYAAKSKREVTND